MTPSLDKGGTVASTAPQPDLAALRAHLEDLAATLTPAALWDIVDVFLNRSPANIETIRAGLAKDNAQQVADAAHCLKGSSSHFGTQKLVALCQAIQERSEEGTLDGVDVMVGEVEREFERLREFLRTLRKTL